MNILIQKTIYKTINKLLNRTIPSDIICLRNKKERTMPIKVLDNRFETVDDYEKK